MERPTAATEKQYVEILYAQILLALCKPEVIVERKSYVGLDSSYFIFSHLNEVCFRMCEKGKKVVLVR